MDDRFNTIAGWVLGAGIVALGTSIVSGEYFHAERPEKMGYVVEGVEAEAGGGPAAAEVPIETMMATADPAKGAEVFKKCAACHVATKGGPNGIGPDLWGAIGKPHGHVPGFAYSDALKAVPGAWDFAGLNKWLTSPRAFAPGTKMTFAGLSKPEDRANVIAYLNQQSDSPLPMPKAAAAPNPVAAEAGNPPKSANPAKATDAQAVTATPAGQAAGK